METWFLTFLSITLATIITSLLIRRSNDKNLPPGPSFFFSNLLLLTHSFPDLQSIMKNLKLKYGPLVNLYVGTHPFVFVGNRSLSQQLLIQRGAMLSDRPKTMRFGGISSASYGPTWRLLRHNLVSTLLHPSNVKSYSLARKWVICIMIDQLREQQEVHGTVNVCDHIQLAMLRLSVYMCFGEKLDDHRIQEIAIVQDGLLSWSTSSAFNAWLMSRSLAKILFRNKWKKFDQLRKDQKQLLSSLIRSRTEAPNRSELREEEQIVAYIDTLVKLQLPVEDATMRNGGMLTQNELVRMCGEFLVVGTEATSTALQWIMANLVKHPRIQCKLYDEIVAIVGQQRVEEGSIINEEHLEKMTYLKAVVLEGLRRHPPGHTLLPHRVSEDVEIQGYMIPKGATINFLVAEMGWDPEVWDDPMEFKPERFFSNKGNGCVFDIARSKEIKMMPFGAGRRICPGLDLALLHLQYFIANLIYNFHWSVPDGYHVDLTEKVKFTVTMKNPLKTTISSRTKRTTI